MRNYLQYSLSSLEKEFSSNLETGLTNTQYQENIKKYGDNKIVYPVNLLKIILSQFNLFNILLLLVAGFLYYNYEGHDYIFILAFVVIDVTLGSYQEYQGHKTSRLLKKLSQPEAEVTRDGIQIKVPFDSLTSGDVVSLQAGDLIPSDMKLISSQGLVVDESIFSGSHQEILKDFNISENDSNILLAGTHVIKGTGKGIVVYTGEKTKSKALNLSEIIEEKTTYQKLAEK